MTNVLAEAISRIDNESSSVNVGWDDSWDKDWQQTWHQNGGNWQENWSNGSGW